MARLAAGAALLVLGLGGPDLTPNQAAAAERGHTAQQQRQAQNVRPQRGKASYYGREFYGKRMANGARFNPNGENAAHKTLPLGTTAKVTNLENGKTAEVKVEDRGPYVGGRVIDVSPKTANQLDMKKDGTAPVVVEPIRVPETDERVATR
ncbi:septal ring lytic transglycosylase RlpA family protein [Paracraurococcus lichenis]|uniref:Endolytic peptidoglycan transglycosylase RlpA n=1 Tax=Paracraurococcus lichenis TaxID=3064888 RepID=A0ABT9E0J2_9PROT|nr:septal ring lytic transglycosylase RlpA family protein [Paracraurococcus sp. LOR1-02]MDO9709530.1 septal ring lytic transglycosylase RlpA family protein [Paracraurococcus sp. LOR1-02]